MMLMCWTKKIGPFTSESMVLPYSKAKLISHYNYYFILN